MEGLRKLGINFDIYHRISDPLHRETSQAFFKVLEEKGVFEVKESFQFYDKNFKQFLTDRYVVGTCPRCTHPEAHGDQCEKCGSDLSPTELIEPRSILSNERPELRKRAIGIYLWGAIRNGWRNGWRSLNWRSLGKSMSLGNVVPGSIMGCRKEP